MKNKIGKKQITLIACFIVLLLALSITLVVIFTRKTVEDDNDSYAHEEDEYIYLSDITATSFKVGDKTLYLDRNYNGDKIQISIDGHDTTFYKGVFAHAQSEVIYDLSKYHYSYLQTYIGVESSIRSTMQGNGVKFKIYISNDDKALNDDTKEWNEILGNDSVFTAKTDSTKIKLNIDGAKYLKLVADSLGNAWSDHAVYADAKLTAQDYVEKQPETFSFIKTIQENENIIKQNYGHEITGEYEKAIFQREFLQHFDYDYLQFMMNYRKSYRDTVAWLMNDVENLKLYILGGSPEGGSYANSLKVLRDLYVAYHSDFDIEEPTNYYETAETKTKGELYKKMAISLSLTHSQWVGLWMQNVPENTSNAVTRYQIYKDLYNQGKMKKTDSLDITKWFENYTVEEMRFLFNIKIDDEEIVWMNDYCQKRINNDPRNVWKYLTSHWLMAYTAPNYYNEIFHDPARKDYWDEKWEGIFSQYGVAYSTEDRKILKLWMNFRNEFGTGAVCGGISHAGMCIRGSHGGASTCIGQPGHCAMFHYAQDNNGNGYWSIDNDVSGWVYSEKGERLLLSWGNSGSYYVPRGTYNIPYMVLAQEALNDYESLAECERLCLLAKAYDGDAVKQEEIYRMAINAQSINLDAWLGLIKAYEANTNKSEDDYYGLAQEIAEALTYFPLPMKNLTDLILPKLESVENQYKFSLLQTKVLTTASQTPNNTNDQYYVYQPGVARVIASALLGKIDTRMASFSFDGENAGKIVLGSRFDGIGVRWDYCLNGNVNDKSSWKEVSFSADDEHKLQLTPQEIASITSENDIYFHLVGVNYNIENLYKIDILESVGLPSMLYANDLENKLMGADPVMQWKYSEGDEWKYYKDQQPVLTGNKKIIVRMGATGVYLQQKDQQEFTFTEDIQTVGKKYIPIEHLSVFEVSSEATGHNGHAANALDGNANTRYHSDWNGSDMSRYLTVELDEAKYISAIEYMPAGGGNGKIIDGTIYGSTDGTNWEVLTSNKNMTYTNNANSIADAEANIKEFVIEQPVRVKYIKIVADRASNGNWFTARMFNFYENTSLG